MFSIIIPLYDKEHTVLRTIYSVLTQTYSDFEVIVVDDCSRDKGVELLQEKIKDSRIRIVRQENQGVSAARNRGVTEAKHDYIAFLDADDEWLPTYLEKVSEAVNLFPDAGIFCTPALHRSILTGHGHYYIKEKYRGKILEIDYFEDPKVLGGQTSGVVVSKIAFDSIRTEYEGGGFPPGLNMNEDWACFQSVALVFKAIYIGYSLSIRNTDVEGQLVDFDDGGLDMRTNSTPIYLNITMRNYLRVGRKNPSFERYRLYEIRSNASFYLRKGHSTQCVMDFIGKLDPAYISLIPQYDYLIYRYLGRYPILAFLLTTKMVFFMRRFLKKRKA